HSKGTKPVIPGVTLAVTNHSPAPSGCIGDPHSPSAADPPGDLHVIAQGLDGAKRSKKEALETAPGKTHCVPSDRVEYLLHLEGLDDKALWAASRAALTLVQDEMATAETDIPWSMRDAWPPQAIHAAERLIDRFVPKHQREEPYLQTGLQPITDPAVRDAFITFAAHAYDATFWRTDCAEVASLADEGTSFAIHLTESQRRTITAMIGENRIVTLAEWDNTHPSFWRSLIDLFTSPDK
ncbi:hypothetical protein, partial [Terrabacter aeriphilus]|uniref:hypothetical protein n=1 Tax=Terrabacter aeriphilus TaxID=515662 RepID=UPI0031ED6055